jgi:competence protein ComEA
VEKYINRAAKLIDGQKIYIYHLGELGAKESSAIKLDQGVLGIAGSDPAMSVNINTASQSELEKLVGIGPVYAQNIIEQRPYSNTQELVSKGAISQKVFEKIKNEISVY